MTIIIHNDTKQVAVRNERRAIVVTTKGVTGPSGILWDNGDWVVGRAYIQSVGILHGGTSYRVILSHVASADNEPGVGDNWETYWKVLASSSLPIGPGGVQRYSENLQNVSDATPNENDILQAKGGELVTRSPTQFKIDAGLDNVDNTSDVDKPVSAATQTALDAKADGAETTAAIDLINANLELKANIAEVDTALDLKADQADFAVVETKVAGIEPNADVTDAANVDAAGAVMNTDTSTAAMGFVGTSADLSADGSKVARADKVHAAKLQRVVDRTAMAALNVTAHTEVILCEAGRFGTFALQTGSIPFSDPLEGLFVASNTAGYYWERQCDRVVSPRHFGASLFGGNSTAAINAMFALQALSWNATDQEFGVEIDGGGKVFYCDGEVGLVLLLQPGAVIRNLKIHSRNTGGVAFNLGGANSPWLLNVKVYGNKNSSPAVGFYIGVAATAGVTVDANTSFPPASECKMVGCKSGGYFSKAAVWNMGSEVSGGIGCFFRNRHRSSLATTYIGTAIAQCFEDRLGAVTAVLNTLPTNLTPAKSNVCHSLGQAAFIREADVSLAITGATQANPVVLSFDPTSLTNAALANGDKIYVTDVVGMTELNNRNFTIANLNNGAGTFELLTVDGSAYTMYTSGGTVKNRTGPPVILEGAGLVNMQSCYFVGFGAPSLDIDMSYGGALRAFDVSFQGETNPTHAVFFTMTATDRTIQGPFKIVLLSAAQSYGSKSLIGKTSGGALAIDSPWISVSSLAAGAITASFMFALPGQFKLRNAVIEVPDTGILNAVSNFGDFTGLVKTNGSNRSMSFYGDVGVNGVTAIDAGGGLRLVSYTAAQIADKTHAVNTTNKGIGKMVRDSTNLRIMVANGTSSTGSWTVADGSASVTPA